MILPEIRRGAAALLSGLIGGLTVVGLVMPAAATPVAVDVPLSPIPVLCVHGIDDTSQTVAPIVQALRAAGRSEVAACNMRPNNGDAGIPVLAEQVRTAALALRQRTGAATIDVVAFSMGALVSRYWLQRLGGRAYVRRFVSISAPHHGTVTAHTRRNDGGRDMRPDSPLLTELGRDPLPWDGVEVYTLWTPFDLMIVPASSGRLTGAYERVIPVLVHPWMLWDGRVHAAMLAALQGPDVARASGYRLVP